jgi:hypothetical protein
MPRPSFRIACCMCGKPIPNSQDAYALDAEWQRRFPEMTGTLACADCALHRHQWDCGRRGGSFVDGHIPTSHDGSDIDSWSHVGPPATHVAAVLDDPWSGLLQGAEEYLRHVARRPGVDRQVAQRLRAVLEQWDA